MADSPTQGQLRAARSMLGKSQQWVAKQANTTLAVAHGLESPKRTFPDTAVLLQVKAVLEANGLELLAATEEQGEGVRWRVPSEKGWMNMLRHGRTMLGLSIDEMAELSGIGRYSIARLENDKVKNPNEQAASRLRDILYERGVLIIPETPELGAGVRVRMKYK